MSHDTGTSPPVIGLLRVAYQRAREVLAGLPITGVQWRRRPEQCPPWCAQDHTCTARHRGLRGPLAEHRSPITTWRQPYGVLVATRVQGLDRRARLELRLQVNLDPTDPVLALAQGVHVPIAVDLAVRAVLAELGARRRAELLGWPHMIALEGASSDIDRPGNVGGPRTLASNGARGPRPERTRP